MPGRTRDEYLDLRRQYQPENIKLVIIAESPPDSGLYFYDPAGAVSEPLFRAFMPDLNSQNVLRRTWLLFLLSFSGQERHSGPKCSATFSPVSDFDQPLGRVNVVHNRRSSPSSAHSARPGQAYVASMEAGRADSKLLKRV